MPRYECVPCKTSLYSAASAADLVDDRCAQCGSVLEPVMHRRIADRIDDGNLRTLE